MYIHRNHEGGLTPKKPTAEGRPSTGPISGPSGKGRSFCSISVEGFQRQTKRPQIHITHFKSPIVESKGYILHKPSCPTMGPHFFQIFFLKWQFLVFVSGFLWVTFIFQMNFCRQIRPLSMAGCGNSKVVNSYVYDTNHGLQATWFSRLRVTLFGDFFPADLKKNGTCSHEVIKKIPMVHRGHIRLKKNISEWIQKMNSSISLPSRSY